MKTETPPELNSTINHSRLITNGDIVSVRLNIVTEIRDKEHLEILSQAMLRAASIEEHKVSQMTHNQAPEELLARIQSYLNNGGLFNPEMMEHHKVRELIIDCQDFILIHHAKA